MKMGLNAIIRLIIPAVLFFAVKSNAQCFAVINNHTVMANGNVVFTASCSPINASSSFTWSFGSSSSSVVTGSSGSAIATTYTANGVYTVTLYYTNGTCTPAANNLIITVNTVTTCVLSAGFNYGINGNGLVFFNNTTTPTTGVTYTWNFGNSAFSNSVNPAYHYTVNGTYTVVLTASSSSSCSNQSTAAITITTACGLSPGILHAVGPGGVVSFTNTTVNTSTSAATYTWSFPGSSGPINSYSQTPPPVTYNANGNYQVKLKVSNVANTCLDSTLINITVNTSTFCGATAGFTFSSNTGTVNFTNTSTATSTINTHFWNFGNGNFSNLVNPVNTYTANGVYSVSLTIIMGTCTNTAVQSVTITGVIPCLVNAAYTYTTGASGSVFFTNASTGTATPSYYWSFGDSTPTINAVSPSHTYTANGNYVVALTASNAGFPICISVYTTNITITNICNINPGFNFAITANTVVFTNTTLPVSGSNTYTWNFGNGFTSSVANPGMVYTLAGTYTVSLTAANGTCLASTSKTITINSTGPCSLNAAINHTVNSSGQVQFNSVSTGTIINTQYSWNFGDGWTSATTNPSHTYINAGTYYILLSVSNPSSGACSDSILQAINVTGIPCSANSGFSLVPTSTPKYWNAIPDYPWNIGTNSAVWDWGDNTSSTGLYASHQYSVSGNYNICLSATVSCGSTSSSCATYSVFRSAADVFYVQVVPPAPKIEVVGVSDIVSDVNEIAFYPNPNNGLFLLHITNHADREVKVVVYGLTGSKILDSNFGVENGEVTRQLDLGNYCSGIYFMEVSSGNKTCTKKLIINH